MKSLALAVALAACVPPGPASETTTPIVFEEPPADALEPAPPARAGLVWEKGRWDWQNGQWTWIGGHFEPERANQRWEPGRWERRGSAWHWVESRWVPTRGSLPT